jgi:hypothetical protein
MFSHAVKVLLFYIAVSQTPQNPCGSSALGEPHVLNNHESVAELRHHTITDVDHFTFTLNET